jgi:hypothetical protein
MSRNRIGRVARLGNIAGLMPSFSLAGSAAEMKMLSGFQAIRTTKAYEGFLKALYAGVKRQVEEIEIPPVEVISITGNQPPASKQFQDAVAVLYGIGYTIKMGLKFGKLPKPEGYFDYKVGALETFWWSVGQVFDIGDSETLRWQAYLMLPPFMTEALVEEARNQAWAKHPGLPHEAATLATVEEGHSVQMLHVGPYDMEQPTIEKLHAYAADHGLSIAGNHHEIYISDPRRTSPEKLKTVIRYAVKPL